MRAAVLCVVGLAALGGCERGQIPVETLEVEAGTLPSDAALGMSADEVLELASARLERHRRFKRLVGDAPPDARAVRMKLALDGAAVSPRERDDRLVAMLRTRLLLRRPGAGGTVRDDVTGRGDAPLLGDSPTHQRTAVRAALEDAIDDAIASAAVLLDAREKRDGALVKELQAPDPRTRQFAAQVLAERRHPAAAEALIAELAVDDPDRVRRAIGSLVELRERRAVGPLIELTKEKSPFFVREVLFALGALGGDEAEAYLYTVAQGHDEPGLREAAEEALEELRRRPRQAPAAAASSGQNRREAPPGASEETNR